MRRVLVCFICVFTLSGCLGGIEISRRGLVQVVGIDFEDGVYKLTLDVFDPSGQNDQNESGESQVVISAEGYTIAEAIDRASKMLGRVMFLGDSRAVVIGASAARERIGEVLRYLANNNDIYPQVVLLVADGEAKDIVSPKTEENQTVLSNALENITGATEFGDGVMRSDLLSVSKSYYAQGAGTAILKVKRRDEGDLVLFERDGAMLFREGRLIGSIDETEHLGLQIIKGEGKQAIVNVEDPVYGLTALEIKSVRTDITPRFVDDNVTFTVDVNVTFLLNELYGFDDGDLIRLSDLASKKIYADVYQSLDSAQKMGCDIFGLYRYVRFNNPFYWRFAAKNWPNILPYVTNELIVHTKVNRLGD